MILFLKDSHDQWDMGLRKAKYKHPFPEKRGKFLLPKQWLSNPPGVKNQDFELLFYYDLQVSDSQSQST